MTRREIICAALSMMPLSWRGLFAAEIDNKVPKPNVPVPEKNTTYIDAHGTAHIQRVIPVPPTVSPEAQKFIARPVEDILHQPSALNVWEDRAKEWPHTIFPVHMAKPTVAGVPTRVVTPLEIPEQNRDRVLINLHGGGFVSDFSLVETIPIANLSQTKVVAPLYRLAPKYPFPAAVDDSVAVYKELLKTYKPENMIMYGTSAGGMLGPQVCVRLRQLRLPLPAALGVYAGQGDFVTAATADSRSFFTQDGLANHLNTPPTDWALEEYRGNTDPRNPVLSPIYADLHGFPPSLFLTSTRDMMLSGTTILHRAFLRSGVDARLVVFEALSHGFWADPYLPESKEACGIMVSFYAHHLNLKTKPTPPYNWT
jgi:acetyl esterase/lipase